MVKRLKLPVIVILMLIKVSVIGGFGQCQISIAKAFKNNVSYLQFTSDSCSKDILRVLNYKYGYTQTLIEKYEEAPHGDEKLSRKEIISRITEIRNNKYEGALATIDYKISYDKNNLLSFTKMITPEGEKKITNSLHSDLNYEFPVIFNLQKNIEIKNVNSFISTTGISDIQKLLKRVMTKRAKLHFEKDSIRSCWIGYYSLEEFKSKPYLIANNPNDIGIYGVKEAIYFFFYFTEKGMEFDSNDLIHQGLYCNNPSSHVTIPWVDLASYCINKPDNLILNISKNESQKFEKIEWIVVNNFTNILDTPDDEYETEIQKPVKPYLVKGDKVNALAIFDKYLKIRYTTNVGNELIGWVLINDLH